MEDSGIEPETPECKSGIFAIYTNPPQPLACKASARPLVLHPRIILDEIRPENHQTLKDKEVMSYHPLL